MIDLSSNRSTPPNMSQNGLQFMESSSHTPVAGTLPSLRDDGAPFIHEHTQGPQRHQSARDTSTFTPGFLKTARHPLVCIFHFIFKIGALITFLFGSFLFGGWEGDYVFSFVTTTALLSIDFWTVKNITGRFLVGMRWWNHIKEDGSSEWIYEAHTDETIINLTDKTIFWTALYLWPLSWFIFLFIYILRLEIEWVLLIVIGLALSSANFIGYWKCSKESKKKIEQWATNSAMKAIVGRFF